MEGLGKDCIIMESIGAGQSDKDLFFLCDTVITIFTPEYGDDIQLFKAGLMEIGDIIVVNKSDKPGAEDALREIGIAVDRISQIEWMACPGGPLSGRERCGDLRALRMRSKPIARPSRGRTRSPRERPGTSRHF